MSIQDILRQTFTDFELIICDDCSTDSTQVVCREFLDKDSRIRYYRHGSNKQMPANVNFGIQKAKYDYIAILHDGDRFMPDLIEQWYIAITRNESVGLVFCSIGVTDANNKIIVTYRDFDEGIIDQDYLLKKVYFRRWRFDSPVYGEVMVERRLFDEYGFFKKKYGFYADVDFSMQSLHSHDAYYCADTLITGPSKNIQPRLFEDNRIRVFMYLFDMHLAHRRKAFESQPLMLAVELVVFWMQAFLNLTYVLLLTVKNSSFKLFIEGPVILKQRFVLLIPWLIMLLMYPLVYPLLKLFTYAKNQWRQRSQLPAWNRPGLQTIGLQRKRTRSLEVSVENELRERKKPQ